MTESLWSMLGYLVVACVVVFAVLSVHSVVREKQKSSEHTTNSSSPTYHGQIGISVEPIDNGYIVRSYEQNLFGNQPGWAKYASGPASVGELVTQSLVERELKR